MESATIKINKNSKSITLEKKWVMLESTEGILPFCLGVYPCATKADEALEEEKKKYISKGVKNIASIEGFNGFKIADTTVFVTSVLTRV